MTAPRSSAVGIIAEYNPFHNGHLYHLEQAKEITGARAAVIVMSGDFMQRGEPAIADKWLRTRMALAGGADLIIELPCAYAVRSAEAYARGAVKLLAASGLITDLCCACETPDLPLLTAAAEASSDPETLAVMRQLMQDGMPYAAALGRAAEQRLAERFPDSPAGEILKQPNNILAIQYLRSISELSPDSRMTPHLIRRIRTRHDHDLAASSQADLASAAAIRELLLTDPDDERLSRWLPAVSLKLLHEYRADGFNFTAREALFPFLRYELLHQDAGRLARFPDVAEGLENSIAKAVLSAESYADLVGRCKSKRYHWTRIQRILITMLLHYTAEQADMFDSCGGPQYIRILGFNSTGRELLRQMRTTASLPIITRPARQISPPAEQENSQAKAYRQMLQLDLRASDLYELIADHHPVRKPRQIFGQEFLRHPVITDEDI